MIPYKKYAGFYDILYRGKDYAGEERFLENIFKKYSKKKIKSVLDLGCGTGNHDFVLAERGYNVWGIDLSAEMIKVAKKKKLKKDSRINFIRGDIRNFNFGRKFGAAIAMFGVFCYLTKNRDLFLTLHSIGKHLQKGSLLIFDCWFGPAVLAQKPREKKNVLDIGGGKRIIKSVKPRLDVLSQTVDLEYKLAIRSGRKVLDRCTERHKIRFFFPQELNYLLEKEKFKIMGIFPFKKLKGLPDQKSWNITVIAKKQ